MPPQGSFGKICYINDFVGSFEDVTWAATSVDLGLGWYLVSVNEGTIQKIVDESNGVIEFLTDTGDNDNAVLISGPYRPSDGDLHTEGRYKVADDLNVAFFSGFSETMAQDTPVMPAEFSTATMTYNGSGGMGGWNYDLDGTTDDFRALAGDGGAASGTKTHNPDGGNNGIRANQTITLDEYYITRTTIGQSGDVICEIAHDGVARDGLVEIERFKDALTNTDLFYAVHMCENRAGAAHNFQVDYVAVEAGRNWAV